MYVLFSLPLELTPLNPPRPTWLIAKLFGTEEEINEKILAAKENLNISSAFLCIFQIREIEDQDQKTRERRTFFEHRFKVMPLTLFDAPSGLTWSFKPTTWFFPKGIMVDLIERDIKATQQLLEQNEGKVKQELSGISEVQKPPIVLATSMPRDLKSV